MSTTARQGVGALVACAAIWCPGGLQSARSATALAWSGVHRHGDVRSFKATAFLSPCLKGRSFTLWLEQPDGVQIQLCKPRPHPCKQAACASLSAPLPFTLTFIPIYAFAPPSPT